MMPTEIPPVPCWYRRLAARAAPMTLFEALYRDEPSAFLYESLEERGTRGRYSFIGARPRAVFKARGDEIELTIGDRIHRATGQPLEALRAIMPSQSDAPPVAPFCGGAVGYLSYDTVRWIERIADGAADDLDVADAHFLFPREVICFDHLEKVLHVLLYMDEGQERRFEEVWAAVRACGDDDGARSHTEIAARASRSARSPAIRGRKTHAHAEDGESMPPDGESMPPDGESMPPDDESMPPDATPADDALDTPELKANMSRAQFEALVARAKEYIYAGDVFQVVLSQRFEFPLTTNPLNLYKALRITNPSPYMYYLKLDDLHVAGSSPEILVRLIGRRVITRPLAGTRRRGNTPAEDEALARELQSDPKERAEHVMLVDLGRNDLGRVCDYGEIELTELLQIERHSKVMHLVSNVEGWLREGRDAFDVFRAVFPAGTVSGAPKVRAMEIIEELEPSRRGVYAGAIGYFSLLGDVDLCIAIRTIVTRGERGYIQAGAGIVADSVPALEYEETLNKARALMKAVALAQGPTHA